VNDGNGFKNPDDIQPQKRLSIDSIFLHSAIADGTLTG
jgi:hypothetical protein